MSDMKTLLENFRGYHQPKYGAGNLTIDDVNAVLQKLGMQGENPQDIWDEFKHLNNADELEQKLSMAQAFFGEGLKEERFTGGSINIEPLSDEEQTASTEAYYELFEFLMNSNLPGSKPSEKLQYALRWIAKFEQTGAERAAHQTSLDTDPQYRFAHGVKEGKK